jgi:hypothetical protein
MKDRLPIKAVTDYKECEVRDDSGKDGVILKFEHALSYCTVHKVKKLSNEKKTSV